MEKSPTGGDVIHHPEPEPKWTPAQERLMRARWHFALASEGTQSGTPRYIIDVENPDPDDDYPYEVRDTSTGDGDVLGPKMTATEAAVCAFALNQIARGSQLRSNHSAETCSETRCGLPPGKPGEYHHAVYNGPTDL